MVSPFTTFEFQSPKAPDRKYSISVYQDGTIACSCPQFVYRGKCYHLALPATVQRVEWELKKANSATSVAPSKSTRVRLEDLYPD